MIEKKLVFTATVIDGKLKLDREVKGFPLGEVIGMLEIMKQIMIKELVIQHGEEKPETEKRTRRRAD